jgi:hypothetical protein
LKTSKDLPKSQWTERADKNLSSFAGPVKKWINFYLTKVRVIRGIGVPPMLATWEQEKRGWHVSNPKGF